MVSSVAQTTVGGMGQRSSRERSPTLSSPCSAVYAILFGLLYTAMLYTLDNYQFPKPWAKIQPNDLYMPSIHHYSATTSTPCTC